MSWEEGRSWFELVGVCLASWGYFLELGWIEIRLLYVKLHTLNGKIRIRSPDSGFQ